MKIDTTKKQFIHNGEFPLTERKDIEKSNESKKVISVNKEISKKNFNILLSIGKGGFGKVWKV